MGLCAVCQAHADMKQARLRSITMSAVERTVVRHAMLMRTELKAPQTSAKGAIAEVSEVSEVSKVSEVSEVSEATCTCYS